MLKPESINSENNYCQNAVLIIGGGIAGVQAALDLAETGVHAYIVERKSSIGGVMAQLDKTFPTNDCSMCILAPKLVEAGRHHNITLLPNSEVVKLWGKEGDFTVDILRHPRYVDENKCIGCGTCTQKCPMRTPDEFNMGMVKRKSIYIQFPQAVPLKYAIDPSICLYLTKGRCGLCAKACPAGAIDYDQKEEIIQLKVGAVVVAPGLETFNPKVIGAYGYGVYPNVLTSIEFERMLGASGPTKGHVQRPSDGAAPAKIAFIQCVGSRDEHTHSYCSSVCCMYALKEAIIAQEHTEGLDVHIFFMDVRAFGKEFDDYVEKAQREFHVGVTRANRIAEIVEVPTTHDLLLRYNEAGEIKSEIFSMIVLSVGLVPPKDAQDISKVLSIELNRHGFAKTTTFAPLETNISGVFVAGAFSGPKDIPTTVAEASGAAIKATAFVPAALAGKPSGKELPLEREVIGEEPRIGVFVCHCGMNIAGVVNVPEVVEYAKKLPNVVYAESNLYTCSQDTQGMIKKKIAEHNLNRIIVAACTPRTHEPLFQKTVRESGLNQYLFEMANIRDQCSWIHMHEPQAATKKSKDLVRIAVAKARHLESLAKSELPVNHAALVVGGGVSGMAAAIDLANLGFKTHIVEREKELGGIARKLSTTLWDEDVQAELSKMIEKVTTHPNIVIHMGAEIDQIEGYVGNFKTTLKGQSEPLEHGVVILASGGVQYKPTEYLYGKDPRVVTQLEFENELALAKAMSAPAPKSVVFIQCVGSRNEERPWCSRICCGESIKQALRLKTFNPSARTFVLFRDLRTYSFKEDAYKEASEKGVLFIRFEQGQEPRVRAPNGTEGLLEVEVFDSILGEKLMMEADRIVLAAAILPQPDNKRFAQILKVPLSKDKFFLEAHMKLRPVDFATEGVFLAGMAHSPKYIDEAISQASGAASRAATILSKPVLEAEGIIAQVNENVCDGCGICAPICSYNAITIDMDKKRAIVNACLCKGCGTCVGACPSGAMEQKGFKNEQLLAMIEAALPQEVG